MNSHFLVIVLVFVVAGLSSAQDCIGNGTVPYCCLNNGILVPSVGKCVCPLSCMPATGSVTCGSCSSCPNNNNVPGLAGTSGDTIIIYADSTNGRSPYTFVFGNGIGNCTHQSTTFGPLVYRLNCYSYRIEGPPSRYLGCFNNSIDGNYQVYKGSIRLQATDTISSSVGVFYKFVEYSVPFQFLLQNKVTVISSLQAQVVNEEGVPILNLVALITSQRIDVESRTVYLEFTTSVNYPAKLKSLEKKNWPTVINPNTTSISLISENCPLNDRCVQLWRSTATLLAGNCYFSGTYTYQGTVECASSFVGNCPYNNTVASIADSLVSENVCGGFSTGTYVSSSMKSFADASFTTAKTSFSAIEGGHFRITAEAYYSNNGFPASIQSISVESFYTVAGSKTTFLASSGTATAKGVAAGYAVYPISSNILRVYYSPSMGTDSSVNQYYQTYTAYAVIIVKYNIGSVTRSALHTVQVSPSYQDFANQLVSTKYEVRSTTASAANTQVSALVLAAILFVLALLV